jgi:hypothetical protein
MSTNTLDIYAPPYTPFFGAMGAASAMVFSGMYRLTQIARL